MVSKAATVVAMASNPAQLNQPVAIRAGPTMAGIETTYIEGNVSFTIGGVAIPGCSGVPVQNLVAICNTTFPQLGSFTIDARYSGSANTEPSAGGFELTVAKVVAGTYLAAAPEAPVFGAPLTLNALLLGAPDVAAPTGTVTFTDGGVTLGTAAVGADGRATLTLPGATQASKVGAHSFSAAYSGDANYQSSVSRPLSIVVGKAPTDLAIGATPAQVGQSVILRAVVTVLSPGLVTPGGTVSFSNAGNPIPGCTGLVLHDGVAACSATFSQHGGLALSGSYSGDTNTAPSTATMDVPVGKVVASIYSAFTPAAPVFGAPVTINVLLLGAEGMGTPTGTVTFSGGGMTLGTAPVAADGKASFVIPSASLAPLAVGLHSIVAAYSGDANYQGETAAPLAIVVARAATSVSLTSTTPQTGAPVVLSAAVSVTRPGSAIPVGTVDFSNGGVAISGCTGVPIYNGTAGCSTTFSKLGDYVISAAYSGDANTMPSAATLSLNSGKAVPAIQLRATADAPVFGAPVTVEARLSATAGMAKPTGTVTFSAGGALGETVPLDTDGRAILTLPSEKLGTLRAGAHSITAFYSGDANYSTADAAVPVNIAQAGTKTLLAANADGALEAAVSVLAPGAGSPTGTVQFLKGGTVIGSAPVAALDSRFVSRLAAGSWSGSVLAVYQGDSNFTSSTSQPVIVVPRALVAITSDRNPALAGQPVTFTVQVTGTGANTPGGTVGLAAGGALIATAALDAGRAALAATLPAGSHTVEARYSGDAVYGAAIASFVQVVSGSVVPLGVTASPNPAVYGQLVTLTARFDDGAAPPSGLVRFSSGGSEFGSAQISDGGASLALASLPSGTHSITAIWTGDDNAAAAVSSALLLTVEKARTTTMLARSDDRLVALVAAVHPGAGAPTGMVQFLEAGADTIVSAVTIDAGMAGTTVPPTADRIVALYSGDANFEGSQSRIWAPLLAVNAASHDETQLSPDQLVTLFGSDLSNETVSDAAAASLILGGTTITIMDSAGVRHDAEILFVSPEQANFIMPAGVAPGAATVTLSNADGVSVSTRITVMAVAPGLFTLNGTGEGVPAAQIVRVHADGTQEPAENVALFDEVHNRWIPAPIDLGSPGDDLYLVLYGTGIRHHAVEPECTIAGEDIPVSYAGPQGGFAGLDQVNLLLPDWLRGAGSVELTLGIGGRVSNRVTLAFQ